MNELSWLEKASSTSILLALYNHKDSVTFSELKQLTGANISSLYSRRDELFSVGLINVEEKPTKKNGIIIGGKTIWISLTPKGKKVAQKLKEIEEIMENEK